MVTIYKCKHQEELSGIAQKLLEQHGNKRIFAFYGSMGAGKTTFIRYICKALGVEDLVGSPTFSIVNQYRLAKGGSVFHFDFYRMKNQEEAFDIGYEDYFYSEDYCLLEWPEKVEELLPDDYVRVEIQEHLGQRTITF